MVWKGTQCGQSELLSLCGYPSIAADPEERFRFGSLNTEATWYLQ